MCAAKFERRGGGKAGGVDSNAPVAKWISRPPSKRKIVGSTPTRSSLPLWFRVSELERPLPLWLSGRASVLYYPVCLDIPLDFKPRGMTPVNVILMETEGPGFDSQERHFKSPMLTHRYLLS